MCIGKTKMEMGKNSTGIGWKGMGEIPDTGLDMRCSGWSILRLQISTVDRMRESQFGLDQVGLRLVLEDPRISPKLRDPELVNKNSHRESRN